MGEQEFTSSLNWEDIRPEASSLSTSIFRKAFHGVSAALESMV